MRRFMRTRSRANLSATAVVVLTKNCLTYQIVRKAVNSCRNNMRILMVGDAQRSNLTLEQGPVISILDSGALPLPFTRCVELLDRHFPVAKKVLLGDFTSAEMCRFLLLGIHGFVSYGDVRRCLGSAIKSVATGHLWVPASVLEEYVTYTRPNASAKRLTPNKLTPRQLQIVALLEDRLVNKEMAAVLRISQSTVKFHLSKLFAKLGVHDRHAATDLYVDMVSWNAQLGKGDPTKYTAGHLGSIHRHYAGVQGQIEDGNSSALSELENRSKAVALSQKGGGDCETK